MSVTDDYIRNSRTKVSTEELEALRSLEVECIMCDWQYGLERVPSGDSLRNGITFPYIDLMKSKLEHDLIVCVEIESAIYKIMHVQTGECFYTGTMIECIEYFRKTLL